MKNPRAQTVLNNTCPDVLFSSRIFTHIQGFDQLAQLCLEKGVKKKFSEFIAVFNPQVLYNCKIHLITCAGISTPLLSCVRSQRSEIIVKWAPSAPRKNKHSLSSSSQECAGDTGRGHNVSS